MSELNTNLKSQEPGGKKGESENNFSVTEPEMTDQPKKDPGGDKGKAVKKMKGQTVRKGWELREYSPRKQV